MATSDAISSVSAALMEHNPRGVGDPSYVPWYAKGTYAASHRTSFTTESGVVVHCGQVVGSTRPGEARKPPVAINMARDLAQAARTESEILALCKEHGIDPALWHSAPNKGVGKMRIVNALKAKLDA